MTTVDRVITEMQKSFVNGDDFGVGFLLTDVTKVTFFQLCFPHFDRGMLEEIGGERKWSGVFADKTQITLTFLDSTMTKADLVVRWYEADKVTDTQAVLDLDETRSFISNAIERNIRFYDVRADDIF